jgi:hypothetical protein
VRELDALSPSYLNNLVAGRVDQYINVNAWQQRQSEIEDEDIRERLQVVADDFKEE